MPSYTRDFVTPHLPNWEKWLAEFKGQPVQALEIGSFEGRSTIWFLENILTHERASIVCVDNFTTLGNSKSRLLYNLKDAKVDHKVTLLEISSRVAVLPQNHYAFAFVDGSHAQQDVLADAIKAFDSVTVGGLVIFDDYLLVRENRQQVKLAVDAFLRVFAHSLEIIGQGRQVCIRRTK